MSGLLLLVFGFGFPGLLWGVTQLLPQRAAGSPVAAGSRVVGFERIGQKFTQARYFQGAAVGRGLQRGGHGRVERGAE